jgi:hypothetical protein
MSSSRSKRHAWKAALLLGLAGVLTIVTAAGMYLDVTRSLVLLWALLFISILPAIGWGSSHLARARGYPTSAGCGLCLVGYFVSGFLGTTSPYPLAIGAGVLFTVLLPTVVLLALPRKSGHSRHGRH